MQKKGLSMLTEFIRKLQRPGRMVVCDPFKIRTTHTSTFPLTTVAARRTFRSNLNTRSRQNSTAYLAGCVVVVSWVLSSASITVHLDSSEPKKTKAIGKLESHDVQRNDGSQIATASGSSREKRTAVKYIPYAEVQGHTTANSCWVIIDGKVYDVTGILDTHPGGRSVLLKNAGKDATKAFVPIHPPGVLSALAPEAYVGPVDPATLPKHDAELTAEEKRIKDARARVPPPEAALNLRDIENLAEGVLTSTAWAYYRSAGDDETTFDENTAAFKRYWFRPRVLNKTTQLDISTKMLGLPCSLPIFIAPAALARLGHSDGEMNLARAAWKEDVIMCLSINSSCSIEEVMSVRKPSQAIFFQLYMNRDRLASENLIKRLELLGFKALILTVDAAVPGKRERDQRAKGDFSGPSHGKSSTGGRGVAHAISGYQDPDVCWDDIPWIQKHTSLPIIIKGIQSVEDAEKAFEYGIQGIILSNHGGRELDYSPSPMTVLHEIFLRKPQLLNREIYIDGGVTRGTDVIKALCLGARAVGLGRAFLYGNGVWGETGVQRVVQIMREEIETAMRLLGVASLAELRPDLIRYVGPDMFAKL